MFVISVAVVGLIGSFATAERSAAAAVTQAQSEVLMRQVTDTLRQSSPYVPCATTSSYSVPASASITDVDVEPAGTLSVGAGGGATPARFDCSDGGAVVNAPCLAGHTCDYGVQRIQVTVTYTNGTLSRVVFKGIF
jgi:Tfp pilus assembly protein PilV